MSAALFRALMYTVGSWFFTTSIFIPAQRLVERCAGKRDLHPERTSPLFTVILTFEETAALLNLPVTDVKYLIDEASRKKLTLADLADLRRPDIGFRETSITLRKNGGEIMLYGQGNEKAILVHCRTNEAGKAFVETVTDTPLKRDKNADQDVHPSVSILGSKKKIRTP